MSHNCNCGCSSTDNSTEDNLLQVVPRPNDTAAPAAAPSAAATSTTLSISGMTCGHCVASVTEELKELDGVQDVEVVLNAQGLSTATVTSATELSEDSIRNAIDEAGYTLVSVNA